MWSKLYSVFLFEASLFLSISLSVTSINISRTTALKQANTLRFVVIKDPKFINVKTDTTGIYYDLSKLIGNNLRKSIMISLVETPQEAERMLSNGKADILLGENSVIKKHNDWRFIKLVSKKEWLAKPESSQSDITDLVNSKEDQLIEKDSSEENIDTYFKGTGLEEINTQAKVNDLVMVIANNSQELISQVDVIVKTIYVQKELKKLSSFYFAQPRWIDVTSFKVPRPKQGKISDLDASFKKVARLHGWDWRLIAAIAFKESSFNPKAIGPGNALGLMQFMPYIATHYKLTRDSKPEVQLEAALTLLDEVYLAWSDIPDLDQRIKFTLASYNAGKGHIEDAQRLASSKGLNPLIWDGHVQTVVESLSDPSVFNRSEVINGKYSGPAHQYADLVYQIYLLWSI